MNPFQNRFQTPAEADVLFGTNGIRRKRNYLNDQPNLGLASVAPQDEISNPEDEEMQPMIDQGMDAAIQSGPEAALETLRGEPAPEVPAAPAPGQVPTFEEAMQLAKNPEYIQQQLRNPRFLKALQLVNGMAQQGGGPFKELLGGSIPPQQGPIFGGGLGTLAPQQMKAPR